jgi:Ribosomal protein S17
MTKRVLQGKVVSTKNLKTLVVNVERKFRHPVLLKVIKKQKIPCTL